MEGDVKISDENYGKIGRETWEETPDPAGLQEKWLAMGRAAVAAVAPILLAEPSDEELTACVVSDEYGGHDGCVKKALANRLASLTAKPDPAVEAVREELRRQAKANGTLLDDRVDCAKLVAAVDAARGGK